MQEKRQSQGEPWAVEIPLLQADHHRSVIKISLLPWISRLKCFLVCPLRGSLLLHSLVKCIWPSGAPKSFNTPCPGGYIKKSLHHCSIMPLIAINIPQTSTWQEWIKMPTSATNHRMLLSWWEKWHQFTHNNNRGHSGSVRQESRSGSASRRLARSHSWSYVLPRSVN